LRRCFRIPRFARTADTIGLDAFRQIIAIEDPLKRDFYAEMCRIEKWSTRTLEKKIGGMLFERTALSKKPEKLIRRNSISCARRTGHPTWCSEILHSRFPRIEGYLCRKDIEAAILREMEAFILEWGRASALSRAEADEH